MSEMNYDKRIEEKLKRIENIEAKKMQLQNELKDLKHRKKTADTIINAIEQKMIQRLTQSHTMEQEPVQDVSLDKSNQKTMCRGM